MEKVIWKWWLKPQLDKNRVLMPVGAEILHVGSQNDAICIWALVDPSANQEFRSFRIFGTGHPIRAVESMKYWGTALILNDSFVGHVFEQYESQTP